MIPFFQNKKQTKQKSVSDFYEVSGERIVYKTKGSEKIYIKTNKGYKLKWGIYFILFGLFIPLFLFKDSLWKIDFSLAIIMLMLASPFIALGIVYILQSNKVGYLALDLKNRFIEKNGTPICPFLSIKNIGYSHLESSLYYQGADSYHVNFHLKNGKEIHLITTESEYIRDLIADFLSKETGIKIDKFSFPA